MKERKNNTKGQHGGPRPNSGRPAVKDKRKTRTFSASDKEYKDMLEKANKIGLSLSEYIRQKTLHDN
ncbi:hypothetical protein V6C27_13820 [Peptococcaceae bacterium 1198_IL3148]